MLGMKTSSSSSSHTKTALEVENSPDWTIYEDMSLVQAIQSLQVLPQNLTTLPTGHTPNWDLVADTVNNSARLQRSSKQCRSRYESVVVPREEGKIICDASPAKKQKKQKANVYKTPQVNEVKN